MNKTIGPYITAVFEVCSERLHNMTDEDLKDENQVLTAILRALEEMVYKSMYEAGQAVDVLKLDVAELMLKSKIIGARIAGLNDIREFTIAAQRRKHHAMMVDCWVDVPFMVKFLQEKQIIEYIYKTLHPALIKKSTDLLKFLASEKQLNTDIIDLLWEAQIVCLLTFSTS